MMEDVVLSWSGGKDSAFALYQLKEKNEFHVKRLLTSVTEAYGRISMHGVRIELLEKQAEALGLPLDMIWLSQKSSNEEYQQRMTELLRDYQEQGIHKIAFGDLFLEDIRLYREKLNEQVGMGSIFPIWGIPTDELALRFIKRGFKTIVVCVDTQQLDASFCGREYNQAFLQELPKGVDPCGENGEFHTFTYAGPIFKEEIRFQIGEKVLRENRFMYTDLIHAPSPSVRGSEILL
jgi:uncharacterized protein (TIGR00290 family)